LGGIINTNQNDYFALNTLIKSSQTTRQTKPRFTKNCKFMNWFNSYIPANVIINKVDVSVIKHGCKCCYKYWRKTSCNNSITWSL